ncbi:MAG: hypothetical protein OEV66_12600, partial [Spirochaetia bacterium]|nr:hypothetical protein [Spirochaetia bacterium]
YLSKIVKDGLGNTLGQLAVAIPSQIYVLNSNGYRFGINIDGSVSSGSGSSGGSSVIRQPASGCTAANTIGCYYSDATCSIAGLLPANAIYANLMPGGVTYDSITLALYYVDKNAVVTPVSVYSSSAAMCTFMFIANVGTINDPAITGVQPSYPLPITIVNQ